MVYGDVTRVARIDSERVAWVHSGHERDDEGEHAERGGGVQKLVQLQNALDSATTFLNQNYSCFPESPIKGL